jgi:hypothetical protein
MCLDIVIEFLGMVYKRRMFLHIIFSDSKAFLLLKYTQPGTQNNLFSKPFFLKSIHLWNLCWMNEAMDYRLNKFIVSGDLFLYRGRNAQILLFSQYVLQKSSMYMWCNFYISTVCVTIDGAWIGDSIYWPLTHTTRNYKYL